MNKTKMVYFEKENILHLTISEENEFQSVKISPNITLELNQNGEIIGLEIIKASNFIRDSILDGSYTVVMVN